MVSRQEILDPHFPNVAWSLQDLRIQPSQYLCCSSILSYGFNHGRRNRGVVEAVVFRKGPTVAANNWLRRKLHSRNLNPSNQHEKRLLLSLTHWTSRTAQDSTYGASFFNCNNLAEVLLTGHEGFLGLKIIQVSLKTLSVNFTASFRKT